MSSVEKSSDRRDPGAEIASCGSGGCGCEEAHKAAPASAQTGPRYWRSLEEYADTEEFREFMYREFPAGASELLDAGDRRHFLRIMGASMALAGLGLAGCRRWPQQHIVPYAHRPEGRSPGVPVQYATAMELGGVGLGLLATSFDGRPIKIEGNPEHPTSRGRTDAIAQASVLDLYDPDRSRGVRQNGEAQREGGGRYSFDDVRAWLTDRLGGLQAGGSGLAVLSEATNSPSIAAMRRRLIQRYPNVQWYEYEPVNNDNELLGSVMAFGTAHRSQYHFDAARVIVSLDADFLQGHPAAVAYANDFARTRRTFDPSEANAMSRLYVCEGTYSLTGGNADERFELRSGDIAVVAARLAARILRSGTPELANALRQFSDDASDVQTPFVDRIAEDLQRHRGAAVVVAGRNQPPHVHMLAHLINRELGAVGETVTYTAEPDGTVAHVQSLHELAGRMQSGTVDTLLILGGNPVYDAPADLDFASVISGLQEQGGAAVHLSHYFDETSELCQWHINRAHYLEAWGDARAHDGTVSMIQPLIEPLFEGVSAIELLALVAGDELTAGYEIVRRTVGELTGSSGSGFERLWRRALHDGVLPESAWPTVSPRFLMSEAAMHVRSLHEAFWGANRPGNDEVELIFVADQKLYDGRFANNGWLQELPATMSKLTWDNALLINPALGKQLGVKTGDVVAISAGERELEAAALLLPGHHEQSATIALGYGRRLPGARIAEGAGFDAYQLRTSDATGFRPVKLRRVGGDYPLAITQMHHAMDATGGRGTQERLPSIFRETTRDDFREHGKHFVEHPNGLHVAHRLSQWEESFPFHSATGFEDADYAWGMSIDLSTCIGCAACVVACQAENNIPVVGKNQVRAQREMHWIRVDRYFKGNSDRKPDSVGFMPVTCMHCENAPCEQVCPVAATVHDSEGLNVMVYNRCIGTRYCSNNCPYKVRRFNYFDFHRRRPHRERNWAHVDAEYYSTPQAAPEPLRRMQMNPEVTIRSRGVMEKCTYCVQRITQAKIKAKNEWTKLPQEQQRQQQRGRIADGEVVPACAQACPTEAIVFGDLKDPSSRVSKLQASQRSYDLLAELNTKPRTRYLGKIRNPAPDRAT